MNAQDCDGNTALHVSATCVNPYIYNTLKEHGLSNDSITNRDGWTADQIVYLKFIDRSFTSPLKEITPFVEVFKIPCIFEEFSKTPLHNACLSGIEPVDKINYLVQVDRRQLFRRFNHESPLPVHMAAMNPMSEALECILKIDLDVDPNVTRSNNRKGKKQQVTPLHISCEYGHSKNVKALLNNHWTDINILDSNKNTPLHVACAKGNLQTILVLKSDPRCRTNMKNKDLKVADNLTPHGVRVLEVAQTGYDFELKEQLKKHGTFTYDEQGENALHKVCYSSRDQRAKAVILIEKYKGLLFAFNKKGLTPFHLAIKLGNKELVQHFIRHCNKNIKSCDDRSLLHIAGEFDRADIAKILIASIRDIGEHINERDMQRNTAAHLAAEHLHLETLKVIQEHPNYNADIPNAVGRTADQVNPLNRALLRMCKQGKSSDVDSLISDGAKSITDDSGNSVFHMIYSSSEEKFEKYDIVFKAFPKAVKHINDEGWTILHRACEDGDVEFVRHMMKNKTDILEVQGQNGKHGNSQINRKWKS